MRAAVLDASVVLKWFRGSGERHLAAARTLRAEYEAGELLVLAPPLLRLELVNVAGRSWGWDAPTLVELANTLDELGLELREAGLDRVALWTAHGLTAYDAAYVALAEAEGLPLITDDEVVVRLAPGIAVALAEGDG